MGFEVVTPAPRRAWRALLRDDPDALPSHAPEWTDAMCAHSPWREQLPLTRADKLARAAVKRLVGFHEHGSGPPA